VSGFVVQVSDEDDVPMSTVELKLGENIFEIHITKVKEFVCEFFVVFDQNSSSSAACLWWCHYYR